MAGSGEVFLHVDAKWGFRIRASDGVIIAVDGGPGFDTKAEAWEMLERVMRGEFNGPIEATAESE
ncbi:MAG: hypothetical protein A2135_02400 [Actinobacteria bacterium RBG_16_67_15]|jgi:hypothetical protein|nr:MAG: hypothetical protein A2135_02400 [Actinobacteria bacterium RBG_16_67_15]